MLFKLTWIVLRDATSIETLLSWVALPTICADLLRRPWTTITYAFVQIDFLHLLINMLWLGWFGSMLSSLRRANYILRIYFAGALSGALCFILYNLWWNAEAAYLTGASAATAAIISATAIYAPRHRTKIILIGNIPLYAVAIIALISFTTGTAETICAHMGGAIAGGAFAWKWRTSPHRASATIRKKMKQRNRKNEILEKARVSGYASLSESERLQLFDLARHSTTRTKRTLI